MRSSRPATARRDRRFSDAITNRRAKSGARNPVIPAIRSIAISIATSASIAPEEELVRFFFRLASGNSAASNITASAGRTKEKNFTIPRSALARGGRTRHDFFGKRRARFRELQEMNFDPVIVSPFDAELFGHWWFEGPRFLESFHPPGGERTRHDFRSPRPSEFLPRIHRSKSLGQSLELGRARL